jgi:DNA-binding response OmpR family regulator
MEDRMAHILIVEDDMLIARLITFRLQHIGHVVTWIADGNKALSHARVARPDLILLDVRLPGMDGLTLLHHFKHNPTLCEIPVLMLTAQSDGRSVLAGIDRGADAYLTKPFSFAELTQRIEACLERHAAWASQAAPDGDSVNAAILR